MIPNKHLKQEISLSYLFLFLIFLWTYWGCNPSNKW